MDELQLLLPKWEALVREAVEENINYEPIPLLSLLNNIEYSGWFIVCVWDNSELCGFFPMQTVNKISLPIMQFSTLFQNHFMSCIPLVHQNCKHDVLIAFWCWFNEGKQGKLLYFSELLPTSKLGNEMLEASNACSILTEQSLSTTRATGNVDNGDFNSYQKKTFSAKSRSSLRSKLRKLDKMGEWHLKHTTDNSDALADQLDKLVKVEGSSWKRKCGTAIALHPNLREFMLDTARYAATKKRFVLTMGFVGPTPVAGMFGLINDGKLLIYKIGFDETYKRYSVGQNTLIGMIEYAFTDPSIHTIDSCAATDAEMFNRCLPDRQPVFEYQIASNHWLSKWCVLGVAKTRGIRVRLKSA